MKTVYRVATVRKCMNANAVPRIEGLDPCLTSMWCYASVPTHREHGEHGEVWLTTLLLLPLLPSDGSSALLYRNLCKDDQFAWCVYAAIAIIFHGGCTCSSLTPHSRRIAFCCLHSMNEKHVYSYCFCVQFKLCEFEPNFEERRKKNVEN